jgi:hypothetical protein
MNSRERATERVKWHLLSDATTDFFSLPEAIEYGISLATNSSSGSLSEENVIQLLVELLDEGLIEFFCQDSFERPGSGEELGRLTADEARVRLGELRWRYAEIEPDGLSLWYSATPKGESAFSSLEPERVRQLFGTDSDPGAEGS